MFAEDDDDKRRRNLMSFSVGVCLAWFFGIQLNDVLREAVPAIGKIPAWKTYLAGMTVDAYLAFRYVVRDKEKSADALLRWPDFKEAYKSVTTLREQLFLQWIERRMQYRFKRRSAFKLSPRPFELGSSSGLLVREPFHALQDGLWEKVLLDHVAEESLEGARLPYFGYDLADALLTAKVVSRHPADDALLWLVRINAELKGSGQRTITHYEDVHVDVLSWTARLLYLESICRVMLGSKLAVDTLLPYYMALLAAVLMTARFVAQSL